MRLFQNNKRKWEEVVELTKEAVKLRLWGFRIRDTKGAVEVSKIGILKMCKTRPKMELKKEATKGAVEASKICRLKMCKTRPKMELKKEARDSGNSGLVLDGAITTVVADYIG